MIRVRLLLVFAFLILSIISVSSKTVYDTDGGNVAELFHHGKAKYILRYHHQFVDTLFVPAESELKFEGGALSGPVVFANTLLTGAVNLKGSSVSGNVRNSRFDASWLCAMDGVTDDAPRINEIIDVCGDVFFPKGNYRLISAFNTDGKLPKDFHSSVQGHIAIFKSNVSLLGELGATFVTDRPLITLSVFSQPNDIKHSISKIIIENITFEVHNDGINFHEFMHTIKMMGVDGIKIKNCAFNDFWGDAICLSHYGDSPTTGERTRNQNVRIIDNVVIGGNHHNNRNGISVINGKNVLIRNNVIKNTSRTDMPGGIDIEPNNSAYTVEDIEIFNNYFEGIWGAGGAVGICVFNGGPAHRITIRNNVIKECIEGIQLYIMTDNTTSDILIKNNLFEDVRKPFSFEGEGISRNWTIEGNTYEMKGKQQIPGKIKVDNLVVKKNKKKD